MPAPPPGWPGYRRRYVQVLSTWRHPLVALMLGAIVFAVYLATVYPGLTEIGDASKFSFVGRILGTPHPPGYPLYVWTSHLFSYVPLGSLAYRMNVLSALWGAATVSLSYLIGRRLGAHPVIAASTALALGFGDAFWSRALYAKVYTLQAALVSAGVLAVVTWQQTRRRRDLLLGVAAFALTLGNHLTVIALIPVLVLFALVVDWRQALRPSTMAVSALIVLAGIAQYLLILVRTLQGAPYLEASARNLSELWAVMTARRFAIEIGAFSWSSLLSDRIPLIWGLVITEMGAVGILVYLLGLGSLLQRQWRVGMLFVLGALGVAGLTANMGSEEEQGFLLSVFVLSWPVVAVGLERALDLLRYAVRSRSLLGAVPAFALLLPSYLLVHNYGRNDHHAETFETAYFDALFSVLPDRALIVNDAYRLNMMVLYKLHGERAGATRGIALAAADPKNLELRLRRQQPVFAFDYARTELSQYGLHFVPVEFNAPPAVQAVLRGRSVFRLVSVASCFDIGNTGWTDVSGALQPKGRWSVKIDNYRPFDARVTLYAGSDSPLSPRVFVGAGSGSPTITTEIFPRAGRDSADRLERRRTADQVLLPEAVLAAPYISRSEIRVNDQGAFVTLDVDESATVTGAIASAVVDRSHPKRATVCSHPLATVDAWPASESGVTIAADSGVVRFGAGWYSLEHRPADNLAFRWTAERAALILPIERPRATTVRLTAEPLRYPGRREGAITLVVNGHRLESRALPPDSMLLEWRVPMADWQPGLNELAFEIAGARRPADVSDSKDTRLLGVSIAAIELEDASATLPSPGSR